MSGQQADPHRRQPARFAYAGLDRLISLTGNRALTGFTAPKLLWLARNEPELHSQIRAEVARRELSGQIKLGPGGIREIEFIAQAFQLIRGGRDPALQIRPTLEVLSLLAQKGLLPSAAFAELSEAYVFLRKVEHRLQYLDDAQTHELPEGGEDRLLVARAM